MNRNHHSNTPSPLSGDDLQQALLELHYGLLDDHEADALKSRIEREPEVARRWAEALAMANQFAAAARVEDRSPSGTPPSAEESPTKGHGSVVAEANAKPFLKHWLGTLAIAASLAVAICGVRYWNQLPGAPSEPLRVAVQPVAGAEATSDHEFQVVVRPALSMGAKKSTVGASLYDASMPIVPATISFRVVAEGAVLFFGTAETSASEPATIRIPDEIAIPPGALLDVNAEASGGQEVVRLSVPLEPTRCLTFLSTDRPVYRPGEHVFFRSVTLNRRTFQAHVEVPIRYELIDPSGTTVDGAVVEGVTERGVGNASFLIPESAPGGPYRLVAKSLDGFFPDQECELEVRRYRAVRLKTDLQFAQRSYGPGDRVQAELTVRRADDSVPAAARVRVTATVDEQVVHQSAGTLSLQGELSIAFDLPSVIREGQGILSVAIDDGSVTETAARPIPIHTGRAEVDFYPEGGYLVGGLDNRIYFVARNSEGKPIEIEGEILSQSGRVVATVKTVRDGMGKFSFKPDSGQRYSLRVTKPLDITETPWLPSVVEAIPVLDTHQGVFDADETIQITIRSTKRRRCLVRSVCRGELVGVKTVDLAIGDNIVNLPIQDRATGVIRVTVLDAETETATPLVERLVYRNVTKRLTIAAVVDDGKRLHAPGESVRMTIRVNDEHDRPVPGAVLGVSVVDDAALSLRPTEVPSMRTHFLLTSEIRSPEDLEHANFYLDDSEEARESLDLLLGTQGWRRFVSGSPDRFDETFRDALTRLLELDGRRAGLVEPPTTNDASVAEQIQHYRRRVMAAWTDFVREVRFALIVIGSFWLIGFVVRPRRSTATATAILVISISAALQFGCGANNETYLVPASDQSSEAERQPTFGDDSGAMAELEAPDTMAPDTMATGETAPASESAADQPFVERVVRTFLGQRGDSTDPADVAGRISRDQLRRWAKSKDLNAQALADQLMEELRFPIRQYAHVHRRDADSARRDFTETLYWNPAMVTDSDGTASIRFDLSDSLTMFRVHVDGHGSGGRLGSGSGSVITSLPVQVDAKVPLEVSGGDRIDLPVGVVNATDRDGPLQVSLETDPTLVASKRSADMEVGPGDRSTEVFPIEVNTVAKMKLATLRVAASLPNDSDPDHDVSSDQVERTIRVVPIGFPFETSHSGELKERVLIPRELRDAVGSGSIVAGSLAGSIELFPSTRSQLSAGLESMLREPRGCFEQASASNYPNVMAIGLLQLDGAVNERASRDTAELLRRGYRKLTSYECDTLGYEWFGDDPGHEALSAFGLMQFAEMAKFIEVDREMMERTRDWLLSRRDGQGGFQRNPRHLHVWSVSQDVVNAYVLWAISEADIVAGDRSRTTRDLSDEIDAMRRVAETSDDPYLVSLSAITLGNVNRIEDRDLLLDRLGEMQHPDGSLTGQTTITQSGGLSLAVETTSLAVLAWSQDAAFQPRATNAARWLINHRRGGGFGSTQATILALKALIAVHDSFVGGDGGEVEILVDGKPVDVIRWEGRPAEGVHWEWTPELVETLRETPSSEWELRNRGKSTLPFSLRVTGTTTSPPSDPNCPIDINVAFPNRSTSASVTAGDAIDVIAEVANLTDQGRPMTVAVIGLPGGLEPITERLDQLVDAGEIDFYELDGREVVLYWRTLAPRESKRLPISCIAEVGGRYTGPPSRAYLYYTAESKIWRDPLVVEINAAPAPAAEPAPHSRR